MRGWMTTLALSMLLAACAHAEPAVVTDPGPRSLPAGGPVTVSWTDPEQFAEIRLSGNRWEARRGDWVRELAEHLRERATARLPAGEQLDVEITDIERAGDFEPWRARGQDIRIVRDIYPPRISLRFTLKQADGTIVAEGERKLADPGYLMNGGLGDSDPLRFEKRLLDDWIRREFPRGDA